MANKFLVLYLITAVSFPNGIFPTFSAERQYQPDYDYEYPVYGPQRPSGALSRSFLRAESSAASPAPTQYMKNTKCFNCETESKDASGKEINCDSDLTGRNTSFSVEYISPMCKRGCHFTHYTYNMSGQAKGPRIYRACAENERLSPYFGNEEYNCKKQDENKYVSSAVCVCIRNFCNKASKEEIGRLKTHEPYKSIPNNVWFPFGELSAPTEPTTTTTTTATTTATSPTTTPTTTSTTTPTTTSTTTSTTATTTTAPPTTTIPTTVTTPATTTSTPTTQTTTTPTTPVTTRITTQPITSALPTTTLSQKPQTDAPPETTEHPMFSINPASFATTKSPDPFATTKTPEFFTTSKNPDVFMTTKNPNLFTTSKNPDGSDTSKHSHSFATSTGATTPGMGWSNATNQGSAGVNNNNQISAVRVVAVHKHYFYKPVYPASLRAFPPGPFHYPVFGPMTAPGSRKDTFYG